MGFCIAFFAQRVPFLFIPSVLLARHVTVLCLRQYTAQEEAVGVTSQGQQDIPNHTKNNGRGNIQILYVSIINNTTMSRYFNTTEGSAFNILPE